LNISAKCHQNHPYNFELPVYCFKVCAIPLCTAGLSTKISCQLGTDDRAMLLHLQRKQENPIPITVYNNKVILKTYSRTGTIKGNLTSLIQVINGLNVSLFPGQLLIALYSIIHVHVPLRNTTNLCYYYTTTCDLKKYLK